MAADSEAQETRALSPEECVSQLEEIKSRIRPMLVATKDEYANRVREGYPTLIDNIQRGGVFGLNLDPGFGVYFMTDGESIFAELHYVSLRTDALSSANREKFSGAPVQERRDIDASWNNFQFRNLVSELLYHWTTQQTFIYRVDS